MGSVTRLNGVAFSQSIQLLNNLSFIFHFSKKHIIFSRRIFSAALAQPVDVYCMYSENIRQCTLNNLMKTEKSFLGKKK